MPVPRKASSSGELASSTISTLRLALLGVCEAFAKIRCTRLLVINRRHREVSGRQVLTRTKKHVRMSVTSRGNCIESMPIEIKIATYFLSVEFISNGAQEHTVKCC